MRKLRRKSTAKCNLHLYSDYLLVSPRNRGCTRLAEAMENVSHDSVNRYLLREEFTPYDLFKHVGQYIALVGGTLSVDDSILDKPYSKKGKNEWVGFHYSGKHHRKVQGICMVSLFYTDRQGVKLPVNYRLYPPGGNKTKNELFREMLQEVLDWGLKPAVVTGDAWYASLDNLKLIRKYQLDAMFGLEKDRLISNQPNVYEQVGQADIPAQGLSTHLKGFDFVTIFRRQELGNDRHYLYYSADRQQDVGQGTDVAVFEMAHSHHWHIESFHRAFKQLCNAENFLVRTSKAVENHLFSAYWAFVKLEVQVRQKIITNWYEVQRNLWCQLIKAWLNDNYNMSA